jgi:hypothetical protein
MTVRTVWYILFSFYNCSNGAVFLVLHFKAVRAVWCVLFFISWQFERCGIFSFSFNNIFERCGIFVFHLQMKNKIYHTVRNVIKWKTKHNTRSKCFKMKNKIYHTNSNGVIYFVLHLTTVRTLRYILFFILRQFEWYGIVNFSFYACSNGVVYFVFHFYDSSNGAEYLVLKW